MHERAQPHLVASYTGFTLGCFFRVSSVFYSWKPSVFPFPVVAPAWRCGSASAAPRWRRGEGAQRPRPWPRPRGGGGQVERRPLPPAPGLQPAAGPGLPAQKGWGMRVRKRGLLPSSDSYCSHPPQPVLARGGGSSHCQALLGQAERRRGGQSKGRVACPHLSATEPKTQLELPYSKSNSVA